MGRILRWGSLQLCQSLVNELYSDLGIHNCCCHHKLGFQSPKPCLIYVVNPRDLEAMQLRRVKFAEEYRDEALKKVKELRQLLAKKDRELLESHHLQEQLKYEILKLETQLPSCRSDLVLKLEECIKEHTETSTRLEWQISNANIKMEKQADKISFLDNKINMIVRNTVMCKGQQN